MKLQLVFKFFAAVATAIVGGILAIFLLLPYDASFKKVVERQVKEVFCTAFKSRLNGSVKRINILKGEIELEHVAVVSLQEDDSWSWKAEQFIIQFSWLSYLVRGKFDVSVALDKLFSHSKVSGSQIFIVDHLQSFIAGAEGFPATLKSLVINKGSFRLIDSEKKIDYSTYFNGSYGNIQSTLYVHLAVENGELRIDSKKVFDVFNGSLHASIANFKQPVIDAVIDGTLQLAHLTQGKNICHIEGQWHKEEGQFFIHTSDAHYAFSLYNWQKNSKGISGDVRCTAPLDYVSTWIPALKNISIEGYGNGHMRLVLEKDVTLQGELLFSDILCSQKKLGNVQASVTYTEHEWRSTIKHFYNSSSSDALSAEIYYHDILQEGTALLESKTAVPFGLPLGISLGTGSLNVALKDSSVTGSYAWNLNHQATKDPWQIKGELTFAQGEMQLNGNCSEKKFEVALSTKPNLTLSRGTIYHDKEKPLLDVTYDGNNVQGLVDIHMLKDIGITFFNYKVPGQGIFEIKAVRNDDTLKTRLVLKEGNIRVPLTFTIIKDLSFDCSFDYRAQSLVISDGIIELDKGTLECKRAVVRFDEHCAVQSAFIPIVLKKAFLTLQKDVFAVVSGFLLLSAQKNQQPVLQGNLTIDRSYCKKNIFSQLSGSQGVGVPFINNLFASDQNDLAVKLTVETKKPVEVKTSFLEMQVQIDASLHGTLHNPELSGALTVVNGTLAFPYRPLHITHGVLYFLPHQLYDPTIELVAKGKIRKYHIILRCNGSLKNPTISFESMPALTEEQIITLLLAGTEEGSLSLAMPALIMQKLQNIMFGPEQSALKLEGYFKSLLEPLKHIRFIPGFSDQSGRGGFRGSIEIDVSDQLRAMIQKNFSLTEDIKFEVEYFFSDDITVRGIRDERADFGGEVEMRWKF